MLAKRTYLRTHPWITFDLEPAKFAPGIWLLLGETTSKATHIAGVPLSPEVANRMHQIYVAKGALGTAAIEGNTLTEDQVLQEVQGVLKLPPSQAYLQQEVQNIIAACNVLLTDLQKNGRRPVTIEFLQELNERVLAKLELDDGVEPGKIRQHEVVVGNVYKGAPPEDCHFLLEQMCRHIEENDSTSELDETKRRSSAILNALFAHIYMALIHPFGDGNGRTARLLEFYILLRAGLASPTGHLLSNHYNQTRNSYYRELDKISKSGGDTRGFIGYALQGFRDGLVEQISQVRNEQMRVTWINYVYGAFDGAKTPTAQRRKDLVLALGDEPVKLTAIEVLSPQIAKYYAVRTDKTLTRDINALVKMGLIRRFPGRRIAAAVWLVRAFLPWSMPD